MLKEDHKNIVVQNKKLGKHGRDQTTNKQVFYIFITFIL